MKTKISIITPAYKCGDYLNDYYQSIKNQLCLKQHKYDYEILYAVDNCQETLTKAKQIKDKKFHLYLNNEKRVGPYVLRNSLIEKATGEYILFFDADDIMLENMLDKIMLFEDKIETVRFCFFNFTDNKENVRKSIEYAHGVFLCKKEIFNTYGGFLPWLCGADSEFIDRTHGNNIGCIQFDDALFMRRIHCESLTRNEETSLTSDLRNEYRKLLKIKRDVYQEPEKINLIKI